ncbi:hypothetical protein VNO78_15323 [Psophocarpus tetragonolobus]|uniref:Bowman-Birk serine protease inhibitors family domain-containing protein n=1 Tax=Psophocarpus tetragonolobus TaxID=3891 RepID=A0AAN9XJN8_PSOTE
MRWMGLKKVAVLKVGLLLFLMGFTATATVKARLDPIHPFITHDDQMLLPNNYYVKSTTTACCNRCLCTKSTPLQCKCRDVGTSCHSACKNCYCTTSVPPRCHCNDMNSFCYDNCLHL